MGRRSSSKVHGLGCSCKACTPRACGNRRAEIAKGFTRALFLVAALIAVPFIIAHAIAGANGGQR